MVTIDTNMSLRDTTWFDDSIRTSEKLCEKKFLRIVHTKIGVDKNGLKEN